MSSINGNHIAEKKAAWSASLDILSHNHNYGVFVRCDMWVSDNFCFQVMTTSYDSKLYLSQASKQLNWFDWTQLTSINQITIIPTKRHCLFKTNICCWIKVISGTESVVRQLRSFLTCPLITVWNLDLAINMRIWISDWKWKCGGWTSCQHGSSLQHAVFTSHKTATFSEG